MSAWDRLEEAEAMLKFELERCGLSIDNRPLTNRLEVLASRLADPVFSSAYVQWQAAREEVLAELRAAIRP